MNLQHSCRYGDKMDFKQRSSAYFIRIRRDNLQKFVMRKRLSYNKDEANVDKYLTLDMQNMFTREIENIEDISRNEGTLRNLIQKVGDDYCFYKYLSQSGFLSKIPNLINNCHQIDWKNKLVFNDCLSVLLILISHSILFKLNSHLFCNRDFLKSVLELSLQAENIYLLTHLNGFLTNFFIECTDSSMKGELEFFCRSYAEKYFVALRNIIEKWSKKQESLIFMESAIASLTQLNCSTNENLACKTVS